MYFLMEGLVRLSSVYRCDDHACRQYLLFLARVGTKLQGADKGYPAMSTPAAEMPLCDRCFLGSAPERMRPTRPATVLLACPVRKLELAVMSSYPVHVSTLPPIVLNLILSTPPWKW